MLKGMKMKLLIGVSAVLMTLFIIYLGMGIFFIKHFYYQTTINGEEVGGKTVSEVEALLQDEAKSYRITLQERKGKAETISGADIGYIYELKDSVAKLKKEQKAFGWLTNVWKEKRLEIELEPSYDEKLFKKYFNDLECFLPENSVEPKDATLVFEGNAYIIKEGDEGSKVKKDKLYRELEKALLEEGSAINLEDTSCYEVAKVTLDSKELIAKRDALNAYVDAQITYRFGDRIEVLDGKVIRDWVQIDENNEVTLDEAAIRDYVKQLAINYDTLYSTRQFDTSVDSMVTVAGGDYGWRINKEKESQVLIELLNKGNQKIFREPEYEQEAWCRDTYDVGDTYVEINLTRQYLWLYKEGKRIAEGSIVSGTGSNSYATPEGTYRIDYKQTDTILRGPGYASPVSFWMPFNSGIGIHDATWRSSFGGSIYVNNGSHGCINTPYELAQTIFSEVEAGMPVICYKDTN